jgi:hypothetical protein
MKTVLPNCDFCLGHIANLKEGENKLLFQNQEVTLFREHKRLISEKSKFPSWYILLVENGFIWLLSPSDTGQNNSPKTIFAKFVSWPTTTITYRYEAPFKVVMENLYDINHIAGTHKETLLAKKVEVVDLVQKDNYVSYTLKSFLNTEAFKKFPWYQKLLFWLLRRGKKESLIQNQPVEVYFPGVFIIQDSEEYKNEELERLTVVILYPRTENSTEIVITGQAKINPILLKIVNLLQKGENPVLKEDKNILENCYQSYDRKIKLKEDALVDYARERYEMYS